MTDDGMSPGDLLAGRYRLIDRLGAGGMAVIWRAHDETLERLVAVKVLDLTLSSDVRMRDLVRREAWAAARLNHPDVASVHDFVTVGEFGVLVMQLVEGEPVADRIAAGPLPWREAVRVASRVAQVLDHAHHRGVIHRDITPDNIVVHADRVTVLDFGIAARIGEPDDDGTGASFGTPAYVAPERLDGTPAKTATDIYALGVVLFEMLTARVPFRVRGWDEVAADHGPIPQLRIGGLPVSVRELVTRMLARRPSQRPRAHEVTEVLAAALAPLKRSKLLAAVGAGAVAASVAVVVWWPRSEPLRSADPPMVTPLATPVVSPGVRQSPSAAATSPSPLSRDRALYAALSAISDGVAQGTIRPDAGLDLKQLLRDATDPAQLDHVRAKIITREREGALEPAAARSVLAKVDELAAAMRRA